MSKEIFSRLIPIFAGDVVRAEKCCKSFQALYSKETRDERRTERAASLIKPFRD